MTYLCWTPATSTEASNSISTMALLEFLTMGMHEIKPCPY